MQTRQQGAISIIDISNAKATASISLFGGQVLSYKPVKDGRERLYLSSLSKPDGIKAFRGGIPVCWPWFGAHSNDAAFPAHGYVRTRQWQVTDYAETDDKTRIVLQPIEVAGHGFAGKANLILAITVGDTLQLALTTRNTDTQPFSFTCALHSYFAVNDITQVRVEGLRGEYSDKTRDWAMFDTPAVYCISEETDRIHQEPVTNVDIVVKKDTTSVCSLGHDSLVVWNPWTGCAKQFTDMPAQDYRHMLCVETALTKGITLAPGASHLLQQEIV